MPSPPILETRGLTRTYRSGDRELVVLADVDLTVPAGTTCAIVGPSGSGKTTLLGLCAGLDAPSAGTVSLDGQDLGRMKEEERAALRRVKVGFVFQNFQLIPTLTAVENVLVPLELQGARTKEARERAAGLLDRVGLGKRLDHYPAQLSGGEQQRVALARAFIHRPRILFADEPTGNLDGESRHRVESMLFDLNAEAGTTLVIVTHDLELAGLAAKTVRLREGRVAEETVNLS